mmetsp:Transcript_56214/g.100166  ORF Transcript_56214/g.100166 Transcript_56214/m.100166 type:complete len:140 (+) Transcript_56214:38-457(+)
MALPLPTLPGYDGVDSLGSFPGSGQPPSSKVMTPKIASSCDVPAAPWGDRPPARPLSPQRSKAKAKPKKEKKSSWHFRLSDMALVLLFSAVVLQQFCLRSWEVTKDHERSTYQLQWFPGLGPHERLSTYRLEWFDAAEE